MPSAANGALRRHQKDEKSVGEGSPKRLTNTAARASAPPNSMSEDAAATSSQSKSGPASSSQQKAVASSDSAMEVNGSSSSPTAPQDDSSYQPSSSQQTDMSLDAAKQVIEAARTALATSDEPLVPQGDSSRNGRRAATSPSSAAGLLDKATVATTAAAAVQAATTAQHPLTTEILPAPPRLPFDPTYPPLDPDAPPLPVHAPNSMAAAASHPIILPNGVVVQPVPAAGAAAASGSSSATNSSADKKRKQPSFALQKPEGYDSKVPYALYAIVNGLPEADNKAKAGGRRKQAKGTKQAARTSRSSTPVVPRADGAASNGASGTAAQAAAANGKQAGKAVDAASLPHDDDMLADCESDLAGSGLVGSEIAPDAATPSTAPLLQINGESTTRDAASVSSPLSSSPSSPPPPFSSSSPSSSSNLDRPHPSASDRHMAEAEAEEAARAAASSSSGAIGDANDLATVPSLDSPQATINATTNAVKTPKTTLKKGKKAQQQQLQKGQSKLSFALATANSSTGEKAAAPGAAAPAAPAAPQQLGAQSSDDQSDGAFSSPASTSKIDPSGNVAPATPIAAAAATTNELMSSRASTPASASSALTPVPPDNSSVSGIAGGNGTGSSSLLGAAPGGGARPTRAAVAKVAARGSYYDPSTYATATPPPQAAMVHGLGAGGEAGSTSTNGAPSSATGSRKGRKSAAGAGAGVDAKGKGRESATQSGAGNGLAAGAAGLPLDATFDGGNEEFCSTCFGTGHFICCDSCPRSFHFACVNPPLDINEVPLDDDEAWHCQSCSALRHPPPAPLKASSSSKAAQSASAAARAFSHLNHHASTTNPTLFSLPPDVKNFFKGVGSERDGSFLDTSKLRTLKTDKKGLIEERDPFRLKDAKGKQVLCFSCGKSALPGSRSDDAAVASTSGPRGGSEWRRIISCDYCSLHWHLDCLDPPLASMPSQFRRWKCPCHIEDLLEHTRIPKSSAQVQVIDLPVPTVKNVGMRPGQFYRPRVLNSGQIDIVPDPLDTYWSSTGAGGAAGGAGGAAEASGRGLHRGWTNMEIPQADALIPGGGMRKIKFRLPEKVVRTDWWMKVLDGSGGRERLVDADAVDVATAVAATQGRFANGLDFLASVAAGRLGPTEQQQQQAEQQVDDEQLIRVALNGSAPASVRLAPLSEHVKDPPPQPAPQGELPHGGVLKKEENDELPASDLRSTIGMVGELDVKKKTEVAAVPVPVPMPVKRQKGGNDSGSSSDSELSDVDEDAAAEAVHRKKRTKVDMDVDVPAASVEPAAAAQAEGEAEEEDLESLRAIRELMRRKGKDELLAFLRS